MEGGLSSIRIVVLLDSLSTAPAWIRRILRHITSTPGFELFLALANAAFINRARSSFWKKVITNLPRAGWGLYWKMDSLYGAEPDAFAEVDISDLLVTVPAFTTMPAQTRFVDRFDQNSIRQLKDARLDVLLRFGFRIIKGEILNCARFGVWSYHHGDNDFYRGGPAGFWEMYENNSVSGALLQILNEKLDAGTVIYKSFSSTNTHSLRGNRNPIYWKASAFVSRKLKDLCREGQAALMPLPPAANSNPRMFSTPGNWQALKFCFAAGFRILAGRFRRRHWRQQWYVALAKNNADSAPQFTILEPPAGRFYADPFILSRGKSDFIFFEDFSFHTDKGVISCVEIDAAGKIGQPLKVLEEPFHLSYPFVFEDSGEVYMVPETADSNSIRLYKCERPPDTWKLERILIENIRAIDPTIQRHDGKYWMFANLAEPGASDNDELHLFFADSLYSNWTAHPKNPVVSDVRCARPAGALFFDQGRLHRVSQNSAVGYGHSMTVHVIEELSVTGYREAVLRQILRDWLPGRSSCTHTLNKSDRYVVTDGSRYAPRTLLGKCFNFF